MKKFQLICLLVLTVNFCQSQEWMTSLDAAQRLAYVQDKLVFMLWEEATLDPYHVSVEYEKGVDAIVNLFENEKLNELIWKYFVPVKVSESEYSEWYNQIKDKRYQNYIDKFNDDTIKIMDINGNIINTSLFYGDYLDIAKFISNYALNTSVLKGELNGYRKVKNFYSAFRLASKYMDVAVLVNRAIKHEIVDLSTIYLEEAEHYLIEGETDNFKTLKQKVDLLKLKQDLILNNPKKVLRKLKRLDDSEIEEENESLIEFLYFTSYLLLKDEINAREWRSKLSLVNLTKANLIFKNNL
ncbi:hypothetical protein OE09_2276 [Flavobacteriaceae bacterium MAR_2010_72]|nr:hypothetical protein OE09_2276 [Flavobacteriaceae bacterium MAR_2010_72]TVZ59014.1 hypothetical protein NA63_1530 [Flavobacteriaceae bacterium MAR_2010_105]